MRGKRLSIIRPSLLLALVGEPMQEGEHCREAGSAGDRARTSRRGFALDWVHRARCRDEDPELFFPIGTAGPAATQIAAAKAICMQCEVRMECLEWAMATCQDAGVWGGLSEEERRALRRARRRGEGARVPVFG